MNIIYLLIGSIAFLFSAALAAFSLIYASGDVRAALLGAFAVASVTLYSNWQIKKREREARFFTEKQAAYQRFADLLSNLMKNSDKNINHSELRIGMTNFVKDLTIWGNAEMIKTYHKFVLPVEEQAEPINPFWRLEDLLRAIRKDLGHDDSSLEPGELIGLMLDPKRKQDLMGKNK